MAAVLPDELLVEILSRVPIKSLRQFMCVSKAWRDLITDPLHRRKLPQTLEGFFFCSYRRNEDNRGWEGVGGVRVHGHVDGNGGGLIDLMGRPVPLVNPSFSFLTEQPGIEYIRILDSCNGLLLLRHGQTPRGYLVCNPATEEWVAVPRSGSYSAPPEREELEEGFRHTFLIFDPVVSSHFNLLQFLPKSSTQDKGMRLRTYSSETGVWADRSGEQKRRKLEEGRKNEPLGNFNYIQSDVGSAYVNGMLHFIVGQKNLQMGIVAVNREGRTCRVISWPGPRWSVPACVCLSHGRLCCIIDDLTGHSTEINIWLLEDYDKEEWTMKHSISVSYLRRFGTIKRTFGFDYRVVAMHPDRNLVFIVERDQRMISYNMDSKELRALCTLRPVYDGVTPYVPYFSKLSALSNKR